KLYRKNPRPRKDELGFPKPTPRRAAQAGPHRVAHEQGARQHSHGGRHAEDDCQVRAPEMSQVTFDQLGEVHTDCHGDCLTKWKFRMRPALNRKPLTWFCASRVKRNNPRIPSEPQASRNLGVNRVGAAFLRVTVRAPSFNVTRYVESISSL